MSRYFICRTFLNLQVWRKLLNYNFVSKNLKIFMAASKNQRKLWIDLVVVTTGGVTYSVQQGRLGDNLQLPSSVLHRVGAALTPLRAAGEDKHRSEVTRLQL